jgi:hypothetical protein
MGLRNRRLMCYKSPGSRTGKATSVRSPEGMATAEVSSRTATILARRSTSGAIDPQLKIDCRCLGTCPELGEPVFYWLRFIRGLHRSPAYNPSFQLLLTFVVIAGVNVVRSRDARRRSRRSLALGGQGDWSHYSEPVPEICTGR